MYAAAQAIGPKVGVGPEALRKWVLQAQVDAARAPGVTTAEQQRIKQLERENRDLKKANEILKAAAITMPVNATIDPPARSDNRPAGNPASNAGRAKEVASRPITNGSAPKDSAR